MKIFETHQGEFQLYIFPRRSCLFFTVEPYSSSPKKFKKHASQKIWIPNCIIFLKSTDFWWILHRKKPELHMYLTVPTMVGRGKHPFSISNSIGWTWFFISHQYKYYTYTIKHWFNVKRGITTWWIHTSSETDTMDDNVSSNTHIHQCPYCGGIFPNNRSLHLHITRYCSKSPAPGDSLHNNTCHGCCQINKTRDREDQWLFVRRQQWQFDSCCSTRVLLSRRHVE